MQIVIDIIFGKDKSKKELRDMFQDLKNSLLDKDFHLICGEDEQNSSLASNCHWTWPAMTFMKGAETGYFDVQSNDDA